MANVLAAAAEEAVDRFYARIGTSITDFEKFVQVKSDQREQTTIKPVDMSGVGAFTAQNADGDVPAADTVTAIGTGYAAPAYEKRLVFTDHQIAKNPGIMNDAADMIADAAMVTISALIFGFLTTLDALVHPSKTAGGYTATGGGEVYFADDFATPVSQKNLIATALSAAGLNEAKGILRGYQNRDGRKMDFDRDPLILITTDTQYDLGADLAARKTEVPQDTGTLASAGRGITEVISISDFATSDDWMLASMTRFPLMLWLPLSPYLRADPFPGAGRVDVYSGYEAGVVVKPHEGGFVYSTG